MPNFLFPMRNADQSWDLGWLWVSELPVAILSLRLRYQKLPRRRGEHALLSCSLCLFFFAHPNCQLSKSKRVKSSNEFLALSSSGHMLYRAAPYYAMRVMSRAIWIVLIYVLVWYGMIWFLNNAAHGGWAQESAVVEVLPTSVWDTDDNTIEAKITTLKFDPRFTQDPSQPHQCQALE